MNAREVPGLTIRQPWASAVMAGVKDVENRSWSTTYRGPLVVHAGKTPADQASYDDCVRLGGDVGPTLPRGVILGVVDLVDVVTDSASPWAEPGLFHWVLSDPLAVPRPVAFMGRLGLLSVPVELLVRTDVAA